MTTVVRQPEPDKRTPPDAHVEHLPDAALRQGLIVTEVKPAVAWAMIGAFLGLAFAVPLAQVAIEMRRGERPGVAGLFARVPTGENLKAFEQDLERQSTPRGYVRPRVQALLSGAGGFGNAKAVVAAGGWLYYRPGVDYVTGPGFLNPSFLSLRRKAMADAGGRDPSPDPRPAVLEFYRQCMAAGARLVLVPVPDKATLEPGPLAAGPAGALAWRGKYADSAAPPNNTDYARFVRELRDAGVDVFDPTPERLGAGGRFLAQDTHWTPRWMESVAEDLARHVERLGVLAPGAAAPLRTVSEQVRGEGDVVGMLGLPPGQSVFTPQEVTVRRVVDEDGRPWESDGGAQVLVLGDSFSNIYSAAAMGWGESAGFVEHFARALRRPVDRIARNDEGAHATRQILADEFTRGRDRLAGKKVVVWQFAARELAAGDWKLIEIGAARDGDTAKPQATDPAVQPDASRFIVPPPGGEMVVSGTVKEAAPAPRPGTVPYKDHIVAVHLTGLRTAGGAPIPGGNALVYLWSMRDNVWTPAATYRPGQAVTLKLRPWADVSGELVSINRSEVGDEAVQFEEPCWGEEAE